MTVRRTSNYTAHFDTPAEADTFAQALQEIGHPIQDHGHTGITFRAADDESASYLAFNATVGPVRNYTLTTGLGVHRREVRA